METNCVSAPPQLGRVGAGCSGPIQVLLGWPVPDPPVSLVLPGTPGLHGTEVLVLVLRCLYRLRGGVGPTGPARPHGVTAGFGDQWVLDKDRLEILCANTSQRDPVTP